MILGHHTVKGTVVYKRPHKPADINMVVRFLLKVVNEAESPSTQTREEIYNNLAPWKTVVDIALNYRKSQLEWITYREGGVDLVNNAMAQMDYPLLKLIWDWTMAITNNWEGWTRFFSNVPYVGAVMAVGGLIINLVKSMIDVDRIEAWLRANQPSSRK